MTEKPIRVSDGISDDTSVQPHVWTDDALSRLLGARDGYIHSLMTVRMMIRRFDSIYTGRFHPRHVRKIAQRDAITKPLREAADLIEADMRRCSATYDIEFARAKAAKATGATR
jgi:hypothetical protein